MAWVGLVEPNHHTVNVAASYGGGTDYLAGIQISTDRDDPFGQGPVGTAIREAQPVWCQEFQTDPRTRAWHERGALYGWSAMAALPLFRHGQPVGAISLYDGRSDAFREDTPQLLIEMASNLSHAMENIANKTDRDQAQQALQASEERFRSLFVNAPLAYQSLDQDGYFLEVNQAWLDTLGYQREDVQDQWFGDFLAPEFVEPFRALFPQFQAIGKVHTEFQMMHKDGRRRAIEFDGRIGYQPNGEFKQTHCILADITDRRQAENEVQSHHAELEEHVRSRTAELVIANKELEAFSYSVSHDLRAPLRAISGYGRMLIEDCQDRLSPEGTRLLSVIISETRRMGQLIDDLLAFSKVGRLPLQDSTEIDMTALVKSVFEELTTQNPQRVMELDLPPLPTARGDAAMLRVVWVNLLSNAVKFTARQPAARISIASCSANEGTANERTIYRVQDNGVGFDMQYASKLFGVFERLHTLAEFEGTGVGLALVQRIIQRHGGRVWADSSLGNGASFYFSLPC